VEYHVRHTNLNEIDDVYNQEVFDSLDFTLLSKKGNSVYQIMPVTSAYCSCIKTYVVYKTNNFHLKH
jgi:6-pyruvoyl-tetrahydropterin synthase